MTLQIQPKIRLDERTRAGLVNILDLVLPGTAQLPSGRAVEAHREMLDLVLQADPGLEASVRSAGEQAAAVETCTLDDLETWVGDDAERVIFALHAAYYMTREPREALGYPGQGRHPIAQATPDQIASDQLVAPVVERGPVYVPTPD
ncbi:hypothetical protein H5V45_09760 [Nocardioides sp. KIGAM211]|uniref:Gluconate 2-dehydrogenase subunit 3 family protein n=1 Tax=Nocardioides luti TaxID=2761101 RepID=A0A7X0RID1_9ACTN|nr:hypothetical protein [Nocardioides luti]MBB6627608.1 hypothetical protein [Nocardioides luti]